MPRKQGLGLRVQKLRTVRRLSQEALAKRAGISRGYVARLEIGRHDPTVTTVRKLAKALGVPVMALLE
jgi:transcriptional regulator with XRE-family HTH domain